MNPNILRRLFYPEPNVPCTVMVQGVVLGLFIILFGPDVLDGLAHGLSYGHPHAPCMALAFYYLVDKRAGDSDFEADIYLGCPRSE